MSLAILEQDIPGITASVAGLDAGERRALARAAAELALLASPVDDARLGDAWIASISPSDAVRADAARQVQRLIDELDDAAAAFQIELDELRDRGGADPARAVKLEAQYGRAFTQARACEALVSALEPGVDEAVEGALYEANAALDHAPTAIRALVDAVVRGVRDPVATAASQLERG